MAAKEMRVFRSRLILIADGRQWPQPNDALAFVCVATCGECEMACVAEPQGAKKAAVPEAAFNRQCHR
jgi:hypothetical protein